MRQPRRPHEVHGLTTGILLCATALCAVAFAVAEWHSYLVLADYIGGRMTLPALLDADHLAGELGKLYFVGAGLTVVLLLVWTWQTRAARREWVLLLAAWLVLALTRNTTMDGTLGPVRTAVVGLAIGGVLLVAAATLFVLALRAKPRVSRA